MWQFTLSTHPRPLYCQRRSYNLRSAASLAQYDATDVQRVGILRNTFSFSSQNQSEASPAEKAAHVGWRPPLDWSKVKNKSEVMLDRDATVASVMQKEVLSKHHKALMLFGVFHLFHNNNRAPKGLESAVQRYEKDYPGITLVIGDLIVSTDSPAPGRDELEGRMASWPVPSLVQNIRGTWLEDVDKTYFSKMVDAYLYLGPSSLMLVEPRPAEISLTRDIWRNSTEERRSSRTRS